jgi:hypothetical protein
MRLLADEKPEHAVRNALRSSSSQGTLMANTDLPSALALNTETRDMPSGGTFTARAESAMCIESRVVPSSSRSHPFEGRR